MRQCSPARPAACDRKGHGAAMAPPAPPRQRCSTPSKHGEHYALSNTRPASRKAQFWPEHVRRSMCVAPPAMEDGYAWEARVGVCVRGRPVAGAAGARKKWHVLLCPNHHAGRRRGGIGVTEAACYLALVEELDTPSEGAFANCDKMSAGLARRASLRQARSSSKAPRRGRGRDSWRGTGTLDRPG